MSDDLAGLAADLTKASAQAQRKAGVAIRKTAQDVKATAQSLAPVDTGALRNSITVSMGFTSLEAVISPTVAYAPYVEHGHQAGATHVAPQPFMGPAADQHLPALEQALSQLGGDIL